LHVKRRKTVVWMPFAIGCSSYFSFGPATRARRPNVSGWSMQSSMNSGKLDPAQRAAAW
jgi:hypothetical protein